MYVVIRQFTSGQIADSTHSRRRSAERRARALDRAGAYRVEIVEYDPRDPDLAACYGGRQ